MKDVNPFGLRLPPEVKIELERLAELNRRSLNAEIIIRLEDNLRREKESHFITNEEIRQIIREELAKQGKMIN